MIQQEFEQRVGMAVSASEYSAIEQVYMASDVDKDEFCRLWVMMNKGRVSAAKREAKLRAEAEARKERAYKLFSKVARGRDAILAANVFTGGQQKLLAEIGIEMQGQRWYEPVRHFKTVMEVRYELGKYLGIY